jgi:hypothetical protein
MKIFFLTKIIILVDLRSFKAVAYGIAGISAIL